MTFRVQKILVTVLSKDNPVTEAEAVDGIKDALDSGNNRLVDVEVGASQSVKPHLMARLLHDYGNSADFFGMNSDGTPLEEH